MNTEEKINLLVNAFALDNEIFQVRILKEQCVRQQDFQTAIIYREKEVELLSKYMEITAKCKEISTLLNSEPGATGGK